MVSTPVPSNSTPYKQGRVRLAALFLSNALFETTLSVSASHQET